MSKENAQKFLDDVNGNAGLKQKLLAAASSAQEWIKEAATAGYEMTAEELRSAAEAVIGKPVSADKLIGELKGLFDGQLDEGSLDAVTGGAGGVGAPVPQRKLGAVTVAGQAGTPGGQQMEPHVSEGGPIKVGKFNPGGNQQH